ncbi:MAG: hypothetical protein DRQ24_12655 [Candidatus Latescibacterota bacterium]|nr:MAG: hypothetical protein DRQ24_12655 [Candidatus Latescibacterota bacterium]
MVSETMEARDYIALLTVAGSFLLLALKVDSLVGAILIAVVSYYFGLGHSPRYRRRSRKKPTKQRA